MRYIATRTAMFIWGLQPMKVKCLHGYFLFEPTRVGQITDFANKNNLDLVYLDDGQFTFSRLAQIENYSIQGKELGGYPAIKTYAGKPWDLFEQNGVVYNFVTDQVVPIESVTQITVLKASQNWLISPGLILPGSLLENGERVKSYNAWFSRDRNTWLYEGVSFV